MLLSYKSFTFAFYHFSSMTHTRARMENPCSARPETYGETRFSIKMFEKRVSFKFGPSNPVTYEQAVTMIVRAIGEGDKASSYGGYPDGFLQVAQERNLLKGIQAARGQGLSRSSVAVLLYNYYTAAPEDSHVHNWATRHIGEVGHYESIGVHTVVIQYCDCGEVFPLDTPDNIARWQAHKNPLTGTCRKNSIQETIETATEKQYVVDTPAHDETYCTICGAIQ